MSAFFLIDVLAVFLPLLGAAGAWFCGRRFGDRWAVMFSSIAVLLAALLSCVIFYQVAFEGAARAHHLLRWLDSGSLQANWAIRLDALSALMVLVVNIVSAMVHFYSFGYMKDDKSVPRFMAYLSLFTFFMLMLVTAQDLVQLFFGWEGVGLASYLLIGFYSRKESANQAAMKAFIVNRVGDFGFLLGIFGCYQLFGSLAFDDMNQIVPSFYHFAGREWPAGAVIAALFFMGAMGKSAQIGLHTWLPDAMEGPTPVSALIHAATMVTAGVFMLSRLSPLFEQAPVVLACITIIGALTALAGALMALVQFDIKRVIAYSTMSQLGYMVFAAGVSAYAVSMFHLVTHAFFKALLFLGAGCVIHAVAGVQDMRKMGGLCRVMPWTCGLMWIGALSLAGLGIEGLGGLSGFYSKDMILEAAFACGTGFGFFAYGTGLFVAFLTAFYSGRMLFMTFYGSAASAARHAHEAPLSMLLPLVPLALGALFAGWGMHGWFHSSQEESSLRLYLPLFFALSGFALSWYFYIRRPSLPAKFVQAVAYPYNIIVAKFYFDRLYNRIFVRALLRLGQLLWHRGDEQVIDRFGPDGVAVLARAAGARLRLLQSGYLYHYAACILLGVFLLISWVLWQRVGL
ncbi:MAG: NADH-quinone oxidoreductase subunit L [Alphaproteobacteria bacterium]|nr:NADH-quinone oxidoreductase subunit L [Alphaproteobacteria bacterium]